MEARYGADETEAKAGTPRCPARIETDEWLQYAWSIGLRYAGSVVDHGEFDGGLVGVHANRNLCACRGVPHGILDQVCDGLGEQVRVADDWARSNDTKFQGLADVLDVRPIRIRYLFCDRGKIRWLHAIPGAARFDLGEA